MPRLADAALTRLEVDELRPRRAWTAATCALIAENYGGGPVGVETLAAALSEQRDAIEDVIEPFLMQQGFLQRTPRGRMLTASGYRHLGLRRRKAAEAQLDLLAARTARRSEA